MKVTLYCETELEVLELGLEEVDVFITLLKKYGYSDIEGNDYKFKSANIEINMTMTVYLEEKSES
jgi:hypothetical protein